MHHYTTNMSHLAAQANKEWGELFKQTVPMLALKNDNLLNAVLALSASSLLRIEPGNMELFNARQSYLIWSVRHQRATLDSLTAETADPVCLTSILLLIFSFAVLRERPLEPYTAPLEWLHMGRGAGAVIGMSANTILTSGDVKGSAVRIVIDSYPGFSEDEVYFDPSMRQGLNGILAQELPGSREVRDDETREAYEKTLSYVGSIQKAIDNREAVYALCRRIQAFPIMIPSRFIALVEEQRPRALVVLAHYFAAVAQVRGVWWLGAAEVGWEGTAEREIRAIGKALPPEWMVHMAWPLEMADLR